MRKYDSEDSGEEYYLDNQNENPVNTNYHYSNEQYSNKQIDSNQNNFKEDSEEEYDPLAEIAQKSQQLSSEAKEQAQKNIQKGEFQNVIASMTAEVHSFEEKKIEGAKNNVIYYKLVLGFVKNNKRWFLEKRYSDFDALDKQIRENYGSLPSLPGKTLFKLSQEQHIEDRRKVLNQYIKDIINRRDLRCFPPFRKFINIDEHYPQSRYNDPVRIANFKDFQRGVRDFIYLPKYQTGFVAQSDMNIVTRMDSYFTNMKMPWERKKKEPVAKTPLNEEAVATVGCLQHYRITEDNVEWKISPTWAKTYGSQTNILHWCDEQGILYCGLDSGVIHRYKCKKEKMLIQMEEMERITVHNATMRIMGISVDARVNHMFSISESGYLIVTDLNDKNIIGGKFISSQNLSGSGLKAMIHDIGRNILFVASGQGEVYILNCLPTQPELLTKVVTDQKVCIRGLSRSVNCGGFWLSSGRPGVKGGLTSNYLLVSDVNGYITIFDIGNPGKEKLTKRIGFTQGRPKQRVVLWRDQGREIISGDEDGCVTFWYSKEGSPLYVLKAHQGPITQMRWNEDTQQLITCSKDKCIKIWQLPSQWIDESGFKSEKKEEYKRDYSTGLENQSIWKKQEPEEEKSSSDPVLKDVPVEVKEVSKAAVVTQTTTKTTSSIPSRIISTAQDDEDSDEDLAGWSK